jgi:hypothetical protein
MGVLCPSCGKENEQVTKYCKYCGHDLQAIDSQSTTPTPSYGGIAPQVHPRTGISRMGKVILMASLGVLVIAGIVITLVIVLSGNAGDASTPHEALLGHWRDDSGEGMDLYFSDRSYTWTGDVFGQDTNLESDYTVTKEDSKLRTINISSDAWSSITFTFSSDYKTMQMSIDYEYEDYEFDISQGFTYVDSKQAP